MSAGNVIRLGSGALFALLGLAVLALSRRRLGPLALGAHFVLAGGWIVAANLDVVDAVTAEAWSALMWSVALVAILRLPAPIARREWILVALAFAASALLLLATFLRLVALPPWWQLVLQASTALLTSVVLLVPLCRLAASPVLDRTRVVQTAGLTLPGALWLGSGSLASWQGDAVGVAASLAWFATLAGVWLVAAHRGAGRLAVAMALSIPLVGLVGYAVDVFGQVVIGDDPYGVTGIARILGWTAAAIAILRADLLGVPLPRLAVHRGTVATAVLASFFIVAEVAQNFLADAYGLLMGGVVAGALLFAANPVHRALERVGGTESARVPVTERQAAAPPLLREREQAYREAVRTAVALARRAAHATSDASGVALRDRPLAREEERRLLRLAFHLGVPTPRAIEIHDEIEREGDDAAR